LADDQIQDTVEWDAAFSSRTHLVDLLKGNHELIHFSNNIRRTEDPRLDRLVSRHITARRVMTMLVCMPDAVSEINRDNFKRLNKPATSKE
jgi:hypothetical protein